ncbi:TRAP transporter large permease [Puniceibacterium sp. IMCC21224]|uniref:TRAP transporter large permease n=1 Tax=Puniceibacterium sp. IMCC21224 TaxID=1618204 RepID=UPI00064E0EC7|nr:TRAP transporter large permease [Puniceibacterium sp. IMCC21224]KMK66329.1 TRAP transporter, DctM subunit [Puniceibacterium sp. IMCC21224]
MILTAFTLLMVCLAISLPVAAVLALTGYVLSEQYAFFPMTGAAGELAWNSSNDFILIAAPMFIMMGELMHRSGVSERLFTALTPWFARVPGRLMHTNIAASAVFAATSGSSLATAATIGTVAIPNMDKGGYNRPLFLGSIAAGGTLGILIPPSINMIIYAVLTDTSVADLYAAGFIPGFVLAALFSGIVLGLVLWRPAWGGHAVGDHTLWPERIAGLKHLIPPLALFLVVVGSIYAGVATPTEAAALGLMATVGLVALNGRLTLPVMLAAFEGTVRTTCMIMLIVISAFFLNFVMVSIGLVAAITDAVLSLGWPPLGMLLAIVGFYLLLGCFMETLSMMIATTPIIVPVIVGLGYSPIWWGVVFVILIEAALITPPVGMNLYVVQAVRKGGGAFSDLFKGAAPFLLAMLTMIGLLILFPQLALWLPTILNPKTGG